MGVPPAANATAALLGPAAAAAGGGGVDTVHGWCDGLTGWGPTTDDGNALTMCFCSTVIELPSAVIFLAYAIPRLVRVMREPEVKPAFSWRYMAKFALTLLALVCAIALAIDDDPPSPAVRTSLSLTSIGWVVSLALLVTGYHRHLPSFTCLRLWWVGQFTITVVIFLMHAELHTSDIVHFVRGAYAFICILLGIASLRPSDQPLYQSVDFGASISRINSDASSSDLERAEAYGVRAIESATSMASLSDETPLLDSYAGHYDSIEADSPSSDPAHASTRQPTAAQLERPLERQISSNLLMTGASTSRYNRVFEAFNEALYGSGERNHERKSPETRHLRATAAREQAAIDSRNGVNGRGQRSESPKW